MKKCYFSQQYTIFTLINLFCGLLAGSIIIWIGVLVRIECLLWCGILIALGSVIIIYTILFAIFLNRKYDVSETGVTIQYANRYSVFYSWDDIHGVCIGITHRSGTSTTQDTVIWCATKKGKYLSPTETRRHTSWEYDFFHCNSVITIEFTQERYDKFAYHYQAYIPDFR